ncbi:MAG: type II secretion system F family protein [Oligoflexia bacterium]|nr:type II secretion system F family protein [Oligoflexia bacterium]
MAAFVYQGKDLQGKLIRGQLEAASEVEARIKLRAQKIIPIKVMPKGLELYGKASFDLFSFLKTKPKVKQKELQIFSRQFATMISSGIPIVQSLEILAATTMNVGFSKVLLDIKTQLESGKRLADSMQTHPQIFDKMFVSMMRAGEEGGVLDTILNRLALYIEKNTKIKNKVTGAMWYPAGVLIIATIVVVALLKYVIPKFEVMFKSSGQELPGLTKLVIVASHLMQNHFLIILAVILGIGFTLKYYYETPKGREVYDRLFIRLPIFGSLLQKSAIARFTRTMSTMLSCGVGILDALDVSSTVTGNVVIEQAIKRTKSGISDGKSIVQPLSQEKFIPVMVVQMIGVGEATGAMDSMFGKIADFYEEDVDYAVGALTSIMEPLMMIFLGGIIAIMVVAMYLPIFSMGGLFK